MTFILTVKKREQKRGKLECSLPLSPCMLLMLKSGSFGFHGFVYVCVCLEAVLICMVHCQVRKSNAWMYRANIAGVSDYSLLEWIEMVAAQDLQTFGRAVKIQIMLKEERHSDPSSSRMSLCASSSRIWLSRKVHVECVKICSNPLLKQDSRLDSQKWLMQQDLGKGTSSSTVPYGPELSPFHATWLYTNAWNNALLRSAGQQLISRQGKE